MKKYLYTGFVLCLSILLISWGTIGHKTVATIAENHLTTNAQTAIKNLLGNESLADVSNYGDELRNDPEYKYTEPWHYINLPMGMDYTQFKKFVLEDTKPNIYSNFLIDIENFKHTEKLKDTPEQQRKVQLFMLKFIIHLVGDMHQPMHVSREEDKGGNDIKIKFMDKNTNLHSLWDSGLINREGLTFDQMAKDYDTATPSEIKKWQSESPIQWLWESYEASTKIYADVEKNKKLDDSYYKENIPIVQHRIEMAGIRLAGVLNELFSNYDASKSASAKPDLSSMLVNKATQGIINEIPITVVAYHVGQTICVTSKVYSSKDFGNMVLVNLGAAYHNQLMTVVLRGDAKASAKDIDNKMVTVTGTVIDYKGKPEIIIDNPINIKLIPTEGNSGRGIR